MEFHNVKCLINMENYELIKMENKPESNMFHVGLKDVDNLSCLNAALHLL